MNPFRIAGISVLSPCFFVLLFSILTFALQVRAESGYEGWLRYEKIDDASVQRDYEKALPAVIVTLSSSELTQSAQNELIRGVRGMLDRTERIATTLPDENAILLGTFDEIKKSIPAFNAPADLKIDGFYLKTIPIAGHKILIITAPNERGVLFGTFTLLRKMSLHEPISTLDEMENPYAPVRIINQWDNPNGSI